MLVYITRFSCPRHVPFTILQCAEENYEVVFVRKSADVVVLTTTSAVSRSFNFLHADCRAGNRKCCRKKYYGLDALSSGTYLRRSARKQATLAMNVVLGSFIDSGVR